LAGVRRYLSENLPVEENIECRFGPPIVSGDRAAVEWCGSWTEEGQELTFAGVTCCVSMAGGRWLSTATTTTTSSGASYPTQAGEAPVGGRANGFANKTGQDEVDSARRRPYVPPLLTPGVRVGQCYSACRAVTVLAAAAQLAGPRAPAAAMTSPVAASRASSAGR